MLSNKELLVLRTLSAGLPLTNDPYGALAQSCGMAAADFCRVVQQLKDKGVVRRVGVVLRHYRAGIAGNIMAAFVVPPERLSAVGPALAQYVQISHCYARQTSPDWPYNLYAMVHGGTVTDAEAFIMGVCREHGLDDYILLPTVAELKKSSFVFKDAAL